MGDERGVSIVRFSADNLVRQPPVQWAISQLSEALAARGIAVQTTDRVEATLGDDLCILVAGSQSEDVCEILGAAGVSVPDAPESLALVQGKMDGRAVTLACGCDVRGLVYAVTELADRVHFAEDALGALTVTEPVAEQPANEIRSIARLFTSEVEDKGWFCDRDFWPEYLSMLVSQRFNRFRLTLGLGYNFPRHVRDATFYFAYPFLLSVPGYDVHMPGLSDAERDRNLEMLRFIGGETVARGLDFQLGLWTHAYEWIDSPEANYTVAGLTPENHAAYCRDALRELLKACPSISGVTFRVHGESGVPEQSYDFWRTVFDGIVQCGRQVEVDMHAKGLDQEMIDVALATGLPVKVSPKYWAEHMGLPYHLASIREQERSYGGGKNRDFMAFSGGSRRFLRYCYGDLMDEDRRYGILYRIWPGTQRLLLWGDPATAAGYGRYASFCGCQGMELCEPLTFKGRGGSGLLGGRDGYADAALRPEGGDWEKYLYTYRLIGRLLYHPDTDPEVWRRFLQRQYGEAACAVEEALANASRILPLITIAHHPSASNNAYWPEMYTNMPIVDASRSHPYGDTPAPKRFGTVSALDPALFSSIDEFAEELAEGKLSGKYSPLKVADWLEGFAQVATDKLKEAEGGVANRSDAAFRRVAADVAIQAGLGRFFAEKLRAGVFYALSRHTDDARTLNAALSAYRRARAAWAEMSEHAAVYVPDITFGHTPHLRGHWSDRLAAIDDDIRDMEAALVEMGGETKGEMAFVKFEGGEHGIACEHNPPAAFRRGEAVPVDLAASAREGDAISVRLHYRRVNQAEAYVVADVPGTEGCFRTAIPGDYSDSPYPLQYWFELRDALGRAWFWPELEADLSNQPYFVVRQAK